MRILERLGYRVDVADDGNEALEACERTRYDVVLMDVQMPGLDGFEVTRRIRAREEGGRRTPIVAMTASAMKGDRERCLEGGMDDYVAKPVTPEALDAALRRWVSAARPPLRPPARPGVEGASGAARRGDGRDADVAGRRRHADGRAGRAPSSASPPPGSPRSATRPRRATPPSSLARRTRSAAAARTSAAGGWPTSARSSRCWAARARSKARSSCWRRSTAECAAVRPQLEALPARHPKRAGAS